MKLGTYEQIAQATGLSVDEIMNLVDISDEKQTSPFVLE